MGVSSERNSSIISRQSNPGVMISSESVMMYSLRICVYRFMRICSTALRSLQIDEPMKQGSVFVPVTYASERSVPSTYRCWSKGCREKPADADEAEAAAGSSAGGGAGSYVRMQNTRKPVCLGRSGRSVFSLCIHRTIPQSSGERAAAAAASVRPTRTEGERAGAEGEGEGEAAVAAEDGADVGTLIRAGGIGGD